MGVKSETAKFAACLVVGAVFLGPVITPMASAQEARPVTVVVAGARAVTEQVPVVGTFASREEIQVFPELEGKAISRVLVDAGQHVDKGTAMAVLDATDARMQLDRNSVSIRRAEAAVAVENSRVDVARVTEAETTRTLERSLALQPKGVVSQQLLDEHRNAHARAAAELGLARQSLQLALAEMELVLRERKEIELTIERSTVRAPSAGLVVSRSARKGAMTSISGDPLFLLAEEGRMEFVGRVVETDFTRLQTGLRAEIMLPGRAAPVGGTLRLRAAQVDPQTRTGEVRIELDSAEGLVPGIFARGSINVSQRRNVVIPGGAVRTVGGQDSVFVVNDGVAEVRRVMIGSRQDGYVEVLDGVRSGDMVVLKAAAFLKPQEKVQPVVATLDPPSQNGLAMSALANDDAQGVQR